MLTLLEMSENESWQNINAPQLSKQDSNEWYQRLQKGHKSKTAKSFFFVLWTLGDLPGKERKQDGITPPNEDW